MINKIIFIIKMIHNDKNLLELADCKEYFSYASQKFLGHLNPYFKCAVNSNA